ncbi:hypothetical protein [Nocardia sp. NPDC052566]|uniref:hypothetical protein n=1 Tax=Nocardia sp. NPDC052566 TaxID=3364330 RepID=UPI0037C97705
MVDKTLDELNSVLQQFADKIEDVKNQPDKIDDAFNKAAIATAAAEGGAATTPILLGPVGLVVGGIYGAITHDDFTGYLSSHKEEIKGKIKDLLEKLREAIEGLKAPVAFLQTSEDWLKLKSKIGQAQNNEVVSGNLTGYWSGAAADKYLATRLLQDTALDSAKAICDKLHTDLTAVANAAWQFYSDIVEELTKFLSGFAGALLKIATGVAAPVGISDAIDLLTKIISTAVTYLKKLGGALLIQGNSIIEVAEATDNQKAFKNNQWPHSTASDFDANAPTPDWQAR